MQQKIPEERRRQPDVTSLRRSGFWPFNIEGLHLTYWWVYLRPQTNWYLHYS